LRVKPLATELGLRPSPRAPIVAEIKHGLVTSSTSRSRTAPWSTPSMSAPLAAGVDAAQVDAVQVADLGAARGVRVAAKRP